MRGCTCISFSSVQENEKKVNIVLVLFKIFYYFLVFFALECGKPKIVKRFCKEKNIDLMAVLGLPRHRTCEFVDLNGSRKIVR